MESEDIYAPGRSWLSLKRDGMRLACLDFGGDGPPALLLHGAAGHAGEWTETASWLRRTHRVLALEQRGHGRSERAPADVSRSAYVADAAFAIEELAGTAAVLIGQSLGGHTAMLVAAAHPELVRALVVAEASPAGGRSERADELARMLAAWPLPFDSREAAAAFFGGAPTAAEAWAAGLEERNGGWWPAFEPAVIVESVRHAEAASHWDAWGRISCPTLVVRASDGMVPRDEARAMVERLPHARFVEIQRSSHDLHLERPREWQDAVSGFLTGAAG